MEITEVRIKLMQSPEDRLRGFCSVTFDGCFVVRDLKIIEGNNGPFVAMPSRKLTANCRQCRSKNHLKAKYCNQCGTKIQAERIHHDNNGRAKLYADIAHPVNAQCREMIQKRIVEELEKETKLSLEPGYRSRYDEAYDEDHRPVKPHKKEDSTVTVESAATNAAAQQPSAVKNSGDNEVSNNNKAGDGAGMLSQDSEGGASSQGPHLASAQTQERIQPVADRGDANDLPNSSAMDSMVKSEARDRSSGDSFGAGIFEA